MSRSTNGFVHNKTCFEIWVQKPLKNYSGFVLMVVNMFKVFGLSFLHRLNSLVATSLIQLDVSKVSCVFWVEGTWEKLGIWKLKSIILLVPKHKEDVFKKRKGEAWRSKLNLWMCLVDWKRIFLKLQCTKQEDRCCETLFSKC